MSNLQEILVKPEEIRIDPRRITSLLGTEMDQEKDHFSALIQACIHSSLQAMDPRAGYVSLPAGPSPGPGRIRAGKQVFLAGGIIAKGLRGAEQYHFFLATAGPGPESLVQEHMDRGAYPEAYISDLVGSLMAEEVANQVHGFLRNLAEPEGLSCTNRYSPGYCGWDVAEQRKLFSLFPDHPLGITLNSSCIMTPVKSVSGMAATGSQVQYLGHSCDFCSQEHCIFRDT